MLYATGVVSKIERGLEVPARKKRGRPPVELGDPGPARAKILGALTVYYATGSYAAVKKELNIPTATLHDWIKKYPKLGEDAKQLAMDYRLERSVEAIDKIEYRILEILDSKEKIPFNQLVIAWGIHRDKYDRQMGIADKRELTGKDGKPIAVKFIFGDANLKPYIPDSKNRMGKYN